MSDPHLAEVSSWEGFEFGWGYESCSLCFDFQGLGGVTSPVGSLGISFVCVARVAGLGLFGCEAWGWVGLHAACAAWSNALWLLSLPNPELSIT